MADLRDLTLVRMGNCLRKILHEVMVSADCDSQSTVQPAPRRFGSVRCLGSLREMHIHDVVGERWELRIGAALIGDLACASYLCVQQHVIMLYCENAYSSRTVIVVRS
jgi:hypothetical protein